MSLNADQWQEIDEAFELFESDKDNCLNTHQLLVCFVKVYPELDCTFSFTLKFNYILLNVWYS